MNQEGMPGTQNVGVCISDGETHVGGDIVGGDKYVYQAPAPLVAALHQLPPPPADFMGRDDELRELLVAAAAGEVTICGLQGQGGVGKTALALKLAEELTPNFPDAQIFMDVLGVSEKPLLPGEAMAHVIHAFQPGAKLPEKEQELAGIYHSVLRGKRALLLIDNAKDAAQVKLLIPPSGCTLLVTSRVHFVLPGLHAKDLDTLPPEKSEELLLRITPRIDGEAPAIAKLCGYLPQALRLAATALAERVNFAPADYRQRLADEQNRPKLLAVGNESVEGSISLSYALFNDEEKRHWRMLGIFPETFDEHAAARVWEVEGDAAQDVLGLLTQFSMLEWKEKTQRYRLHDLMRDFARQKATAEEQNEAALRHARYYLDVLRNVEAFYRGGGKSLMRGLALFDLERLNIEVGQAWAANHAADELEASQLCSDYSDKGVNCLGLRQHPREAIRWREAALAAARRLKDRGMEGAHLDNLGVAYFHLGEYRRAIEYHEQALVIWREIGCRYGEGAALGNLGIAYRNLGEYRRAIEYHEQDLQIAREIGSRRSEGIALGNLGTAYDHLGQRRRALKLYQRQLPIAREIGDRQSEADALSGLGVVYYKLRQYRRAIEYHEQHVQIAREIGDLRGEGYALWNISLALNMVGKRKKAIHQAEAALKIYEKVEAPNIEDVRQQLEQWRKA